ncbi:MAG: Shedu anti-phage system protein SduA domain-containing protein [Pseudomonadota bacterium]
MIGAALKAYRDAASELLKGKYAALEAVAPTQLRDRGNIFVAKCRDGILVRYDKSGDYVPKVRVAEMDSPVAEIALQFSEQVLYLDVDPFYPEKAPKINLEVGNPDVRLEPLITFAVAVFGSSKVSTNIELAKPPARPHPLLSMQSEVDMELGGAILPNEGSSGKMEDRFIAHTRIPLPVGWRAVEVYPLLGNEYWNPMSAPIWAELDILAMAAQRNLRESRYNALDSRTAVREQYSRLLDEFRSLLDGPEEPVHQFLKRHPELIAPTADASWSKLKFGDRTSDFVFREPVNDYELVELEAPIRELFRKDGQQREELTHAFNQIVDWISYIEDDRQRVERETGLTGISTNPRSLIVIGRSASIGPEDRRKLVALQNQIPKLRIMTYDDLLASARTTLERILGPLGVAGPNSRIYFFQAQRQ